MWGGKTRGLVLVLLGLVVVAAWWVGGTYNRLVRLDQQVEASWAQVENVYQRRADLVPNLVATVKGAANFEQQTLQQVTEARASVGKVTVDPEALLRDPEAFRRFEDAQGQLGAALSRLIAVSEAYPQLRATENFRDLQAQLEGTENRIAVERMRFNEAAQAYDTALQTFPTNLVAGAFGGRFTPRPYFQSQPGAEKPPPVQF